MFRSCGHRDRVGPYFTCDLSWLTSHPLNPMAVGQYVNNHNTGGLSYDTICCNLGHQMYIVRGQGDNIIYYLWAM